MTIFNFSHLMPGSRAELAETQVLVYGRVMGEGKSVIFVQDTECYESP